jgi:hypothetical protein
MKRVFFGIAALVGIWVLGSFLGTMLDPARAELWTTSLMWAMLSCVVLAPIFLFFTTSDSQQPPSSSGQDQRFEVEDSVDVPDEETQDEAQEQEWPYTTD